MFSRVPQPYGWSGPREDSQSNAVPRRDKSPGEAVITVRSPGFFVFLVKLDVELGGIS